MKKMLGESKRAKRSIALSKHLHLEVIRVNWHLEVVWSSVADFNPSQVSIAELTRNWRAAAPEDLRRRQRYKTIDSSWSMNELALHFYTLPNHTHYCHLYVCAHGTEMEQYHSVTPSGWCRAEWKRHHFFGYYCTDWWYYSAHHLEPFT